ncbi:AAA family ATPase [Halolamina sp. CBA1230]|uniref:AAA family ATPase n=1 Tax=Halolamina sp. CBA1230 TaxID=1853690 RepID=UPI0009A250DC|nr:AAA family ATPase [Halolamina sp. CBA1230]QKY19072.1 AAA family ATPase [Halolamina sp. CBA1230]
MSDSLRLTVRAAEKRDAGRGIARLPEAARQQLGLLSGDTVLIEGERETVAKLWPARGDVPAGVIRIDADSRANAGVKVGDTVRVAAAELPEANAVTLRAPASLGDVDVERESIERLVSEDVRNRPVAPGDRLHLERLSGIAFTVDEADPDGRVRVTDDTDVRLVIEGDTDADHPGEFGQSSGGGSATSAGDGSTSSGGRGEDGSVSVDVEGGAVDVAGAGGTSTGVSYEDIGGLDEELDLVRETVELPLSNPELFARLGIDPPKGVLLHGPPGTGKTLIAKAVANEVDATFISISGPEIMSKYKGESEERVREVFEAAQEDAPAIVFFDEIDSVAPKREEGGDVESRVVGQLLSLMDGLNARGEVVVIGATNRVDEIDPALRRGGRFDREIEIGVPGEAGRREIMEVHTRNMPLADDVRVDRLAERTHGFTGADLASVAKEAAMSALRRARREGAESAETDPETAIAAAELTVTRADFDSALAAVEPSAMREYVAESPEADFEDVGGLEDAKETLERAVAWPLSYGPLFDAVEASPPTGVLLHGPPGTGKTLLARAIAGESGVNFIQVAGPELLDRYVGESEKAVRELFERARQAAPAVVFFDEIDAIATARGGGDSEVGERVVSQLLTELDRAAENPNLVVLAATNRKDALDPALLRPGRFESHVHVPAPGEDARRAILAVHTEGKPLADDVDLDAVAASMAGYTGADVAAVVREATLLAVEDVATRYEGEEANDHADEILIEASHFDRALDAVEPSI